MVNFIGHTGKLEEDSPSLAGFLGRYLPKEEADSLTDLYSLVADLGGLNDSPVTREEGVSFNPRPARLCHILNKELKVHSSELLGAAIILPLLHNNLSLEPLLGRWSREASLAELAYRGDRSSQEEEALYLAYWVDLLRHLHMSKVSREEREETLETRKKIIDAREKFTSNQRLIILVENISTKIR